MANIKTADIKVGETVKVRLGTGIYGTAVVVALHTVGVHTTGVKVKWLDGDRARTVVNPATLETL